MKPRPHHLKTATLALAIGLALNVGIAWACIPAADINTMTHQIIGDRTWLVPPPPDSPASARLHVFDARGITIKRQYADTTQITSLVPFSVFFRDWSLTDVSSGYPLHSMRSTMIEYREMTSSENKGGSMNHSGWSLTITGSFIDHGINIASRKNTKPDHLPLMPIWLPFLANTALYTLLAIAALKAPRILTKRRRIAQGRCTTCGYQLDPQSPQCPECGNTTHTPDDTDRAPP